MKKKEDWINTNRAMEIVKQCGVSCTRTSFLAWNGKYCLGKKIGGRWYIDSVRLEKFLKGGINANQIKYVGLS